MNYLSKPITGFLLLTSQLFSGRVIGIMGFSAGGHLAASLSTHYDDPYISVKKKISLRPDFSILIYPVISFTDSLVHTGSRENLLGKNPSSKLIDYYSTELHVNAHTPPAFLVHAKDDEVVSYKNSEIYYNVLLKNKISAQIKYYEKGGHGFSMNNPTSSENWMDDLKVWLMKTGFLKSKK